MPITPPIGLTGRAGAGKDTVARLLQPYGYRRVALADPVRAALLALDPIIHEEPDNRWAPPTIYGRLSALVESIGWDAAKRDWPEVRALLQRMGTEVVRNIIGDTTWVDLGLRTAAAIRAEGYAPVFTDVRFPNEADAIRRIGGLVVLVDRPGHEEVAQAHASETLDGINTDFTIHNDGTERDLFVEVGRIMAGLRAY